MQSEGFNFGFMGLDMDKNKTTTRVFIDSVALFIDGNNNNNNNYHNNHIKQNNNKNFY